MVETFGSWKISIERDKPTEVLLPLQKHSDVITTSDDFRDGEVIADGVFMSGTTPAAVQTADCMPLVIMTPDTALALHISRHTLVKGLLDTVPKFIDPESITHIWIGSHICEQHFTFPYIGEKLQQFIDRFPNAITRTPDISVSLRKAVQTYFDQWHLDPSIITEVNTCTYESALPSYKRWFDEKKEGKFSDRIFTIVQKVL